MMSLKNFADFRLSGTKYLRPWGQVTLAYLPLSIYNLEDSKAYRSMIQKINIQLMKNIKKAAKTHR